MNKIQTLKFYWKKFILEQCTGQYNSDLYVKRLNSLVKEYNGNFPLTFKAKIFAKMVHQSTNHKYGSERKPYYVHLEQTFHNALKYHTYISEDKRDIVYASCLLHDTIEDCRINYNFLNKIFNKEIAEIVYAVSNEKGKNRKERESAKYYQGIKANKLATFVKLCDRIANVDYSIENNSPQLKMYTNSMKDFVEKLYDGEFTQIFAYLIAVGNLYGYIGDLNINLLIEKYNERNK